MIPTVVIACVFHNTITGRYHPASFKGNLYETETSNETMKVIMCERNYFHPKGFKTFSQALKVLSPSYEYAKVYKKARKWDGPEVVPKYMKLIKGKSVVVVSPFS